MSLLTDLISHWKLNEAAGASAIDSHGSNTLASIPAVGSVAGQLGTARSFTTGGGSVLSIDDNPSLSIVDDPLSIAVWPNLDNTDTLHAICGKYDGTFPGSEYLLFYSAASERYRFNVYDGLGGVASVDANTFGKPTPGVFNLVVAWHDPVADTLNIRVNNGPVDSVPYSGGCHDGGNPFRLGVMPGLSADLAIDSLSLAKRVWSSEEQSFLWNDGAGRDYEEFGDIGGEVVDLAGVSAGRSSAQGDLSVTRGLSGNSTGHSRTSGFTSIVRGLAGVAAGRSLAAGGFNVLRRLMGVAQGVARAIGFLFLSSELLNSLSIDDETIDDASWEDNETIDLPQFSMTVTRDLKPIATGDARTIRRTFRNLPTGATITKAWLTVKRSPRDDDEDALISKEITVSPSAQGRIVDFNTDDGKIEVQFEITKDDTAQVTIQPNVKYPFDLQILRATGQPHTLLKGRVYFFRDITRKNS